MPGQRLSVVVTRRLPENIETRMKELFDVRLREDDAPMSREQLVEAVKTADVLVPAVTDFIDAPLLAQASEKLKLIANYGAILAVTRRIPEGLRVMGSGDWAGWSPTALLGGRIAGRRVGILGMGRIGQAVARRAAAFGMQVHYHNRKRLRPEIEEALEATYWESLDQMVARMDIISINCPHTPSTFHLMNARRLKLMKPDAVIVNTRRIGRV